MVLTKLVYFPYNLIINNKLNCYHHEFMTYFFVLIQNMNWFAMLIFFEFQRVLFWVEGAGCFASYKRSVTTVTDGLFL